MRDEKVVAEKEIENMSGPQRFVWSLRHDQTIERALAAYGCFSISLRTGGTKVKLREGTVRDLFDQWLRARRPFRLAHCEIKLIIG